MCIILNLDYNCTLHASLNNNIYAVLHKEDILFNTCISLNMYKFLYIWNILFLWRYLVLCILIG